METCAFESALKTPLDVQKVWNDATEAVVSVATQVASGAVSVGTQVASGAVDVGTKIAGGAEDAFNGAKGVSTIVILTAHRVSFTDIIDVRQTFSEAWASEISWNCSRQWRRVPQVRCPACERSTMSLSRP